MRLTAFVIMNLALLSACKTTRDSRPTAVALDSLESEEELPACDDITVGRVYWVRSVNDQRVCTEDGTWQPRGIEVERKDDPGFGPRSIPEKN
ncbi:MAG TPA: hypothetical protein VE954_20895 [Oligoflexus sp.]|uniref:hypothetical protein n=1 Tax=Oligoflexus sp. TaxID=1971216 RepID=UPI002D471FA8|nr:hypothetical protein [Oligoflexus sp.]HYX35562.1 hypothetical protein [Oligoflexus sp.]